MLLVDSFQNRLNTIMSLRNIKQVELVEKTGLDKTLINKYLSGIIKAKQDKLTILADALNVNEVWLMGYNVPMERYLDNNFYHKKIFSKNLQYHMLINNKEKKQICKELKLKESNTIYLFRVGIFYNAFNEDADYINKALGLKITHLSPSLYKVGFPINNLDKYKQIFANKDIKYSIIDNLPSNMNKQDYLNNIELKKVINKIIELDLNNTTMNQAFNILFDTQNRFRDILKGQ